MITKDTKRVVLAHCYDDWCAIETCEVVNATKDFITVWTREYGKPSFDYNGERLASEVNRFTHVMRIFAYEDAINLCDGNKFNGLNSEYYIKQIFPINSMEEKMYEVGQTFDGRMISHDTDHYKALNETAKHFAYKRNWIIRGCAGYIDFGEDHNIQKARLFGSESHEGVNKTHTGYRVEVLTTKGIGITSPDYFAWNEAYDMINRLFHTIEEAYANLLKYADLMDKMQHKGPELTLEETYRQIRLMEKEYKKAQTIISAAERNKKLHMIYCHINAMVEHHFPSGIAFGMHLESMNLEKFDKLDITAYADSEINFLKKEFEGKK